MKFNKGFFLSIFYVAGGTAAAQGISLLFSPVVTRIYGPEAFGALGVFVSAASILAALSTMSYAFALALPREDDEALSLVMLSVLIALGVSLVLLVLILIAGPWVAALLGFSAAPHLLILLAPFVLFQAIRTILEQWLIRLKQFPLLGRANALQALGVGSLKVGLGIGSPTSLILIVTVTLGNFIHSMLLFPRALKAGLGRMIRNPGSYRRGIPPAARHYRDYPLYRMPQMTLSTFSRGILMILLSAFFSPAAAGFYAIGEKVMRMPMFLISSSLGQVILPHFAETAHQGLSLRKPLIKASAGLALLGIIPFGVVMLWGPPLFQWVFGEQWYQAGVYAQWLSPWLFFSFVAVPAIQAIPIMGMQHFFLGYEPLELALKAGCVALGALVFKDALTTVALFCSVGALLSFLLTGFIILFSKQALRS